MEKLDCIGQKRVVLLLRKRLHRNQPVSLSPVNVTLSTDKPIATRQYTTEKKKNIILPLWKEQVRYVYVYEFDFILYFLLLICKLHLKPKHITVSGIYDPLLPLCVHLSVRIFREKPLFITRVKNV